MIVQFSISPMDTEHLNKDVARAVDTLESTGLEYRLGPTSTAVEGDWGRALAAIRRCHEAVSKNHERVITTIVIDDRKTKPRHRTEMISRVENQLGRPVKH